MPATLRRLAAGALTAATVVLAAAVPAHAASTDCTRFAAPTGSDAADGSAAAPLRTVQRLIDTLGAGETGCLRGGTYTDEGAMYVARFGHGGAPGAPLTLRSAPGEHATVRGIVFVVNGSDDVTLADMTLDGRASSGTPTPSPQVAATDTVFEGNEITNGATDICMILGDTHGWGRALRPVVRDNAFHDCGSDTQFDHSVYVEAADDGQIVGNTFVRSSSWAVHIYPDAHRTLVAGNVMDDNGGGVIFAGEGDQASTDNVVENNVITGSRRQAGIAAWWGGKVGSGNVARNNCLSNGRRDVDLAAGGVSASGNVTADPGYVDATGGDLRLRADSACHAVFAAAAAAPTLTVAAAPAPAATTTTVTIAAPAATKPAPKRKTTVEKKARAAKVRAVCASAARRSHRTRSGRHAAAARCVARASRKRTGRHSKRPARSSVAGVPA